MNDLYQLKSSAFDLYLADEKAFHESRLRVIESDVKRLLRNQQNLNNKLTEEQDKQMNQYLNQDSL